MNIFDTLLEIKTGRKDLLMKTIYIKDSPKKLIYYTYYYDDITHCFYINWIAKIKNNDILEQIIMKAYKNENKQIKIIDFTDIVNQMKRNKKPKVFYFYKSNDTQFVYIDKINLRAIRNHKLEIKELKIWDF